MEERVWLVEHTISDDEQNILISIYATSDGSRAIRFERAVANAHDFDGVPVSLQLGATLEPDALTAVDDEETRERYRRLAAQTVEQHDPTDRI